MMRIAHYRPVVDEIDEWIGSSNELEEDDGDGAPPNIGQHHGNDNALAMGISNMERSLLFERRASNRAHPHPPTTPSCMASTSCSDSCTRMEYDTIRLQ
jgi:hypothetical protein